MRQYYYAKNDVKYGPYSFDDLKKQLITKTTLIWFDGMIDWKKADQIEELKDILHTEPPPLPKTQDSVNSNSKTDDELNDKYYPRPKDPAAFIIAGFLMIGAIVFLNLFFSDVLLTRSTEREGIITWSIIIKIICAFAVSRSAGNIGRNSTLWFIFSFTFTGLALILYGAIRKKVVPRNFQTFSDNKKSQFLSGYALKLAKIGIYNEALFYVQKAIDYNKINSSAYDARGYIKYYLKSYESALKDADYSIELEEKCASYYHHRAHIKFKLNNPEGACVDWKKASNMGDENAKIAFKKNCKS